MLFKIFDPNYKGPEQYVTHGTRRNKIVYNGLALSFKGSDMLFHLLAQKLGYEVIKRETGRECPVCGSEKTYTTTAMHCMTCAETWEV